MDNYDVLVVEDDRMLAGKKWLLIEHEDGVLFVVRRDALDAQTLVDSWAGFRHLMSRRRNEPPTLRAV